MQCMKVLVSHVAALLWRIRTLNSYIANKSGCSSKRNTDPLLDQVNSTDSCCYCLYLQLTLYAASR